MGVPPFPGFVSKNALITAALQQGGFWPLAGAVLLLISSVLTAIYIFTVVFPAFFMKPVLNANEKKPADPGVCMKIALIALCILLLAAGALSGQVLEHLNGIAGGLMG